MSKFIITEEEKKRILGLYEQAQPQGYSQFTEDVAKMIGVPTEEVSYLESANENLDIAKRREYQKLAMNQIKNITFAFAKWVRDGKLDGVLSTLKGYNRPMNEMQKQTLQSLITTTESQKPQYEKFKKMPEDQWNEYVQKNVTVDTPQVSNEPETSDQPSQEGDEKINTTNDRSYDYKLSGGKYYYTTKGEDNWIEAKGKGLEAIKSKIQF